MLLTTIRLKLHFFLYQSLLCHRSTTPQARIAVTMSTTHNSNVMSEFRDHVVISSWTGSVTPAMQDMLRLTTNGTDFMQELLSTENQYHTALSVLSSAGATRDAAAPELSDEEKQRVIEIARTMVVAPA